MTFVLQMLSALAEPIGVLGYVLCGLMLPRLWLAIGAALAWALAMQGWEIALTRSQYGIAALDLLFPRLTLAALLALAAFLAIDAWRRQRILNPS